MNASPASGAQQAYWDAIAQTYQQETRISLQDFHLAPLAPGGRELGLLPDSCEGIHCLEIACGAGQNSLFLASQGAHCTALDISEQQLDHGRHLATAHHLSVDFRQADMDALPDDVPSGLDLIHSAYGFPFSADPGQLIQDCAKRLNPGGQLLATFAHPVYAGEWLDLEDEQGIFLTDYFHPTPDTRGDEQEGSQSRAFPLSDCFQWMTDAGLTVTRLLEPRALPVDTLSDDDCLRRVPYYSPDWALQVRELERFPLVAVFLAKK